MKVLASFNLLTLVVSYCFSLWAGFGRGGFVFGDPTTTMLIVTCVMFAWTALSVAFAVSPLLNAEPGSMTYGEARRYTNAFAIPAVAAIVLALSFGIRFWTTAYSATFLCVLAVLVIVAFALVSASESISAQLQKPDASAEPATP